MPDLVGELRELDSMQFSLASDFEQTEFDLGGVRGKQREIDAEPISGRTEREGQSFRDMWSRVRDGHIKSSQQTSSALQES